MIKVRILDRCEFCDGEAYIFDCQDVDTRGATYDRDRAKIPIPLEHFSTEKKSPSIED